MYIERLHIDAFGVFQNQDMPALSPGLNVIIGHNEAGKSTCLRFFQSMMFGYKRGNRSLDAGQGKDGGGSLFLRQRPPLLAGLPDELVLTRRPGTHGGKLTLAGADGTELDAAEWQRLLKGLTVEVYDRIFAFSLDELMEFSSLTGDSVRHALHGAAFGTGLRSPAGVLKELENRMGALFKKGGSRTAINPLWEELADIRRELAARIPDVDQYAALRGELDGLEQRLATLYATRTASRRELERIRRRKDVWQQWEETQTIRDELAALGASAEALGAAEGDAFPAFAPDAVQRLDALCAQEEERLLAESESREACTLLENDIARLGNPGASARLQPALQALLEQKRQRRDEAERLPQIRAEQTRLQERQQEVLERLGPGWDAGRAASVDISLAAHEALQAAAEADAAGRRRLDEAEKEAARIAREHAEAAEQVPAAQAAVERCPLPENPLPDREKTSATAADAVRAGTALAELPALRSRYRQATAEARRALEAIDPGWTQDILADFDGSLHARQQMDGLRENLALSEKRVEAAARAAAAAEEEATEAARAVQAAAGRLDVYRDLPDASGLEARYALLRAVERIGIELAAARRDFDIADEAAAGLSAPKEKKRGAGVRGLLRNPLVPAGIFLLCAGAGLSLFGLTGTETAFIYTGAGVGLCALLMLFFGLNTPHAAPDAQALADEMVLLRARTAAGERKKHLAAALADAARKSASWLHASEPDEPGEADILRARRLLENQSRQTALRDRDKEELDNLQQSLAAAEARHDNARSALAVAKADVQSARAAWAAHMRALHLPESLNPDGASGLFDRAAAARQGASAAAEAERTLAAALASLRSCLHTAGTMPFFAGFLPKELAGALAAAGTGNEEQDAALGTGLAALREALSALQGMDDTLRERARLSSILDERQAACARLQKRLAEAEKTRAEAARALAEEQQRFRLLLEERGLDPSLSPQGAQAVLAGAAAFVEREKELAALQETRLVLLGNLWNFIRETAALAEEAGEPLPPLMAEALAGSAAPDAPRPPLTPALLHTAPALLDTLAARINEAARNAALLEEKKEQLFIRSQSAAKARAALEKTRADLAALLERSGAADAESFRAEFARRRRIAALRERERVLLGALHRLAGEENLSPEALLQSLGETSRAALGEEEEQTAAALSMVEKDAAAAAEERGRVKERLEALEDGEGSAPLRRREAELKEELHRLSRQWCVPALAQALLLRAKERFEEEGQAGVIRRAGDIFAAVTGGEYSGLAAGLDGDVYTALHASGSRRDPQKELSRGTREQLYLALRLAYIGNHAANARSIPVIMDDILVNFDPERAANTAQVLAGTTAGNQLLFFTCHPALAEILMDTGRTAAANGQCPEPAAFLVERGTIQPQ